MRFNRFVRLLAIFVAALAGALWGLVLHAASHTRQLRSEVEKLRADHDERRDILDRSLPPPYSAMLVGACLGTVAMLILLLLLGLFR